MARSSGHVVLLCAIGIVLLARPAYAFGAGNIGSTSKIEGQNWRHGDLEDTLLTIVASKAMGGKKFSKLDVKRVYFGNWLRDYSQAVDVGTVKSVSAEAIRILLWVLGFLSFGYGSGEFEVTTERLGCYRPEEHIDNPKDYADNIDARQYDRRLRGPVDERVELAINPDNGMKNYISTERLNIVTSGGMVRKLFSRSIQLGRQYARSKNKKDLYEALRLLGTGSHCLEDFAAHSNYVELALIEMGERDVFPHVGRRTLMQVKGARGEVYPLVTGTFGGVDFLHSVCGEFDDKATQSEIQELEGTLQDASNNQDGSILQDLLSKVPDGVFGGKDQAGKADELQQNAQAHQMGNTRISPRQPEEWTRYVNDVQTQIKPIIEWHDDVMQSITETIDKIPILPDLIDSIQDEVNKFVFSLLAPYVVPVINQVKNELNAGSNEIIQSSADKQHIVFSDDHSSDPTHSMLSKDHFSNILNEPAGKVASATVKWVVPQIIHAWDDEHVDVERTLNRIIHGILHHPACRGLGEDGVPEGRKTMFSIVEKWWHEKSDVEKRGLRDQLSRRGVESGRNHKEGVKDHGHGSGKPLGMANLHPKNQTSFPAAQAFDAIGNTFSEITNDGRPAQGRQQDQIGKMAGEAVGGGLIGGIVGGIASAVGQDMLGGGLDEDKKTYKRESYGQDGSRTETVTQVGHHGDRYGQAQYSRTQEPSGRQTEEFDRFEQRQTASGFQGEARRERRDSSGRVHEETRRYGGDNDAGDYSRREEPSGYSPAAGYGQRDDNSGRQNRQSGGYGQREDDNGRQKRQSGGYGSQRHGADYTRQQEQSSYESGAFGGRNDNDDFGRQNRQSGGYSRQDDDSSGFGGGQSGPGGGSGYGEPEIQTGSSHGRQQESGYGRQQEPSYESGGGYGGHGGQEGYGRSQEQGFGRGGGGYERQQETMPGAFGRGQEETYGGGYEGRHEQSDRGGYGGQQESYGGQQESYGGQQESYGEQQQEYGSGGYGQNDDENQGYGQQRRRNNDDEYSRY